MNWTRIKTTLSAAAMAVVTTIGISVALIIYLRVAGVRSFSKMNPFDFATTVAVGSLVACTTLTTALRAAPRVCRARLHWAWRTP